VCRRSSTACGSCRHFRRSVAAQLGYCGLDRKRLPLVGDEIRACWEGAPAADAPADPPRAAPSVSPAANDRTAVRRLDFVPVLPAAQPAPEPARPKRSPNAAARPRATPVDPAGSGTRTGDAAWSLWGELDG